MKRNFDVNREAYGIWGITFKVIFKVYWSGKFPGSWNWRWIFFRSSHWRCSLKKTLAQSFSSEFCETFKNIFFIEHLQWLLLIIAKAVVWGCSKIIVLKMFENVFEKHVWWRIISTSVVDLYNGCFSRNCRKYSEQLFVKLTFLFILSFSLSNRHYNFSTYSVRY